jgi:hypothetical protein
MTLSAGHADASPARRDDSVMIIGKWGGGGMPRTDQK